MEYYDGDETKRVEEITYDSEIYFIEYTTPHVWEVEYYGMTSGGTHQHISRCTVCGDANGDPIISCYEPSAHRTLLLLNNVKPLLYLRSAQRHIHQ